MATDNSSRLSDKFFLKVRPTLNQVFIGDKLLKSMIDSCKDENSLKTLIQALAKYEKDSPDKVHALDFLLTYIDKSDYSLSEWVQAIVTFYRLLQDQQRTAPLDHACEYIFCATNSPENKLTRHSLDLLTEKMFKDFGYEGK